MNKKSMLKVFISSTYRDLKEVRKLLIQGLEGSLEAIAMERFPPSNELAHKKTIEYLENESDICVFIIEEYYGTVIGNCKINTCDSCDGSISYTHCEYKKALQSGKPHILYLVENEVVDILSRIRKFDLTDTSEHEIFWFLRRNDIDISKTSQFLDYSVDQLKELWEIAKDKNRENLEQFKKEIEELCRHIKISKRGDYYRLFETIMKDLREEIVNWYEKGDIKFTGFAGRRKELRELLEKLHENNSVGVVGTGGVGKTSLIQLALLLEKLWGRKVYTLFKKNTYNYTRAGYSFAKDKFFNKTFSMRLELKDIVDLIFQGHVDQDEILDMNKDKQISNLIDELSREGSILFIDDLQDTDEDVKEFVYRCGTELHNGAVVTGTRENKDLFSAVGFLSGLHGADLKEMILIMAESHSTKEYIEDKVDTWSDEIYRITQGHPMLVDIIVRNADLFPNCEKLKMIESFTEIENQKAVGEAMNRLAYEILTNKEIRFIHELSGISDPVTEHHLEVIGSEEVLNNIIKKGFLQWKDERLFFTFEVIRELIEDDRRSSPPNP